MRRDTGDYDEDFLFDDMSDEYEELDLLDSTDEDDEESIEISMEVDEDGNEIYYAADARIPDSHSKGFSAEEAIEGIADRRREYREMLHRSRDEELGDEEEDILQVDPPSDGDGVNLSLELDENGNEVWYAIDPRVPGSTSKGLSAEEAVDGLEDRRSQYREMLRRSRKKTKKKRSSE